MCPRPIRCPQRPPGQRLEAFLRGLTAEAIDGIGVASIRMDWLRLDDPLAPLC